MSKFQIELVHHCVRCDTAWVCPEPEVQEYAECSCGCPLCEVNADLDELAPSRAQLIAWMIEDERAHS